MRFMTFISLLFMMTGLKGERKSFRPDLGSNECASMFACLMEKRMRRKGTR